MCGRCQGGLEDSSGNVTCGPWGNTKQQPYETNQNVDCITWSNMHMLLLLPACTTKSEHGQLSFKLHQNHLEVLGTGFDMTSFAADDLLKEVCKRFHRPVHASAQHWTPW